MSKREEEILRVIEMALPEMSDFDKGYFLGVAKASANAKTSLKKHDLVGDVIEMELVGAG